MSGSSAIPHSVSFIVPALNEEKAVERVVREMHSTVAGLIANYEIILIDDGSTDRTGQIMDALARELPNVRALHNGQNIGLGATYRRGVSEARLDHVMLFCGDGGLPPSSLPPIIAKIGTADMVVPYMTNLDKVRTPVRQLVSKAYTTLLNVLFGQRLKYYNGLAVHRRALLNRIDVTSTGFGFQAEIILKLFKMGCSATEVGVHAAEVAERSRAFRLKNVFDVGRTIIYLILTLRGFSPSPLPAKPSEPTRVPPRP
jgi:glycosyltransferase involved in cell wall biosynthesis